MDKLKTIIATFLLFYSATNWAQKVLLQNQKDISITTNESVFLHLNASAFVSGETLLYKVYCLNPKNFIQSPLSKVAYVQLIGSSNKIIFNHKLFLENGMGHGDYFIPTSLSTGTYKLVGYTKWMLNKAEAKSFEVDINIINPYQQDSNNTISTTSKVLPVNTTDENTIKTDQKTYASRALVTLKTNDLNTGNYSLSVRKIQDLPSLKMQNSIAFTTSTVNQEIPILDRDNLILPELRGELISGKITSKEASNPINGISVGLSIPGKYFEFKLAKTDALGRFHFSLDKPYYDSNFVVQVVSDFKENYILTLDKPITLAVFNLKFDGESKLNSELKSVIEAHSVASQIENTYFLKKADSISKIKTPSLFYEPTAKEYDLDKYTRFPTIKETITEVIKEMHYYKTKDNYTLYLTDYDPNTELTEPPLVLVDGLMIQDINELLEYGAANIQKVDITPGGYYYGNKIFNGLISFITKKGDYSTNLSGNFITKTSVDIPLVNKDYFSPNYSDNIHSDRIPDYRYQLLWIPDLKSNAETPISFFTSDITGIFEIVLEGFTEDGSPISAKQYFEVK